MFGINLSTNTPNALTEASASVLLPIQTAFAILTTTDIKLGTLTAQVLNSLNTQQIESLQYLHRLQRNDAPIFSIRILARPNADIPEIIVFIGETHISKSDERVAIHSALQHFNVLAYEGYEPNKLLGGKVFSQYVRNSIQQVAEKRQIDNISPAIDTIHGSLPLNQAEQEYATQILTEINTTLLQAYNNPSQSIVINLNSLDLPSSELSLQQINNAKQFVANVLTTALRKGTDQEKAVDKFHLEADHKPNMWEHLESINTAFKAKFLELFTNNQVINLAMFSGVVGLAFKAVGWLSNSSTLHLAAKYASLPCLLYFGTLAICLIWNKTNIDKYTSNPIEDFIDGKATQSRENTMTDNLLRIFNNDSNTTVLAAIGAAHVNPIASDLISKHNFTDISNQVLENN